jgi:hypothetical protein
MPELPKVGLYRFATLLNYECARHRFKVYTGTAELLYIPLVPP